MQKGLDGVREWMGSVGEEMAIVDEELEQSREMLIEQARQSAVAVVKCVSSRPNQPSDSIEFKELWISGRFSDFTIIADNKQFKAHKSILGIRNPVFAKIIEDQSDVTEMKIQDFSPRAVEALLQFIYTGEAQEDDNSMENYLIAEKFEIAKMKSVFVKFLIAQIDESNVFDIYMFAHSHSAATLKKKAFAGIASIFPKHLPESLMENPEKLKRVFNACRELVKVLNE